MGILFIIIPYINPQASTVEFKEGVITIQFQLAAREYQKLHFTFYLRRNTFVLTKAEYYISDQSNGVDKKLEKTQTFSMDDGLDIEYFDYLDFIYQ